MRRSRYSAVGGAVGGAEGGAAGVVTLPVVTLHGVAADGGNDSDGVIPVAGTCSRPIERHRRRDGGVGGGCSAIDPMAAALTATVHSELATAMAALAVLAVAWAIAAAVASTAAAAATSSLQAPVRMGWWGAVARGDRTGSDCERRMSSMLARSAVVTSAAHGGQVGAPPT